MLQRVAEALDARAQPWALVGGLRPQDTADLIALLRDIPPEERERALAAVTRIADLGAHRGKPLRTELEALLGP